MRAVVRARVSETGAVSMLRASGVYDLRWTPCKWCAPGAYDVTNAPYVYERCLRCATRAGERQ
eukprot:8561024-Pyramimonas_sp.AAC.1